MYYFAVEGSPLATLADAMKAQGFNLFRDESSYPMSNAQRNLSGRTFFMSPDTIKFFKAKVHRCAILESGLVLALVDSTRQDGHAREYRPAFFDIFGTCIERDVSGSFRTPAAADKAYWKRCNEIDFLAHYREALARQKSNAQRLIGQCDAAMGAVA